MPWQNFLEKTEHSTPHPVKHGKAHASKIPSKQVTRRRWIILGVFVILALLIFQPAIALTRAGIAAVAAKRSMERAEVDLRALDIESANRNLSNAKQSLSDVRSALRAIGVWRDLPVVGTQVRAVEDAASAGSGTIDSAMDLLGIMNTIVEALRGGNEAVIGLDTGIAPTRTFAELSKEEKQNLLQRFSNQLPQLRLARDKMDVALTYWNRIPQEKLAAPVRNALAPFAKTIPVLQRSLDEAVPLIEVLVPMSGYPTPQHSLIALQNSSEIRPAGGFIGTIGLMTWDAGEMTDMLFTDVYNVDNPVSGVWKEVPPEPIQKYLGLNNWFLRDANWSPDMSVSGERVLDFFIRESELQLHGKLPNRPTTFIALEPGFFESLLQLTGPVTVDGETYAANDFFDKLEYKVEVEWHQKGIPVNQRKAIISKIGDELGKRIFSMPASRWPEILDVVTTALERKQILVYSRDVELQRMFDARGWSGRTIATTGDYIQVVDANLAALKTDGAMKRAITYRVDLADPRGPVATISLKYTNTAKGYGDYRYTRYRTYTRVYVPEGSELLASSGAMKDDLNTTGGKMVPGTVDAFRELGKTVFGAFWSIEPTKTGELTFSYRLPKTVADQIAQRTYRLDWQKQAGVDDAQLTLDLLFDKNIVSATPAEDATKWGDRRYEYQTDSLVDRIFYIHL